ncbi:hypothetical protein LTR65_003864 [Meristemomyces frigidus]
MLANDALHQRGEELGMDGMYFVTLPGHTPNLWPAPFVWHAGPAIFFAPFVRSRQDRLAWANASAVTKMRMCSSYWKHPALHAMHPVLPIWASVSKRARMGFDHQPVNRGTVFPSKRHLQRTGVSDTTILPGKTKTIGAYVDVFDKTFLFAPASELRRYTSFHTNFREHETLVLGDKKTQKWVTSRQLRTGMAAQDPVIALITAVWKMTQASPEHMIGYQEARSWSNRALLLISPSFARPSDRSSPAKPSAHSRTPIPVDDGFKYHCRKKCNKGIQQPFDQEIPREDM